MVSMTVYMLMSLNTADTKRLEPPPPVKKKTPKSVFKISFHNNANEKI